MTYQKTKDEADPENGQPASVPSPLTHDRSAEAVGESISEMQWSDLHGPRSPKT